MGLYVSDDQGSRQNRQGFMNDRHRTLTVNMAVVRKRWSQNDSVQELTSQQPELLRLIAEGHSAKDRQEEVQRAGKIVNHLRAFAGDAVRECERSESIGWSKRWYPSSMSSYGTMALP